MVIRGQEIKNLIVAGCSYSSYTEVDSNYSTFLSNNLKLNNIDGYNAGCGSNQRIWRKIITDIRSGKINSSDLLVIQYTENTRKEIWSKHHFKTYNVGNVVKGTPMREQYGDGQLIKFKLGFEGDHEEEEELFRLFENNFIDEEYEKEIFENTHFTLIKTIDSLKIRTVFLNTRYKWDIDLYDSKFCHNVDVRDLLNDKSICLSDDDCHHLNERGHEKVAGIIEKYLKEI